jgi:DNA-directed RNA polymerase specialized sigma24 family protein
MDEFRRRRRLLPETDKLQQTPVHESTDRVVVVQSTMDQLSPADWEVLYLFDVAGFKTEEIGAMLGVRGSAVRQRLSWARQRFRALCGAEP